LIVTLLCLVYASSSFIRPSRSEKDRMLWLTKHHAFVFITFGIYRSKSTRLQKLLKPVFDWARTILEYVDVVLDNRVTVSDLRVDKVIITPCKLCVWCRLIPWNLLAMLCIFQWQIKNSFCFRLLPEYWIFCSTVILPNVKTCACACALPYFNSDNDFSSSLPYTRPVRLLRYPANPT